jgi:nucleoside-diphosphate-sugar epimerase
MDLSNRKILVTGAGGYVGSCLVPKLLQSNFQVVALDTYWYGLNVFDNAILENPNFQLAKVDIRQQEKVKSFLYGVSDVIHLACISNDPSFDLNPELGKSINLLAFEPIVKIAKASGVQRFIYASSSSVYGVKVEEKVTENLSLEPLTDYSRYKAICEELLLHYSSGDFICTVLRPATVCGWSPRQRFDLSVNILTNHALNKGEITVFGGSQFRPNIHIEDMVDAYILALNAPVEKVNNQIFNVGADNLMLKDIAMEVAENTGVKKIVYEKTNDLRSYRIDSTKILQELGFVFKRNVGMAVSDLVEAFQSNRFVDPMSNPLYFNIKRMQELEVH